jgi:hypothetical protein
MDREPVAQRPPWIEPATGGTDLSRDASPSSVRWPWLLSDRGILIVASLVACLGVAGLAMMWLIAWQLHGHERAQLEVDAIKYGLGFIAAGGAAAALLLSVRRQRLSEHAHDLELRKQTHAETDAVERRVTELYTKAVEQLGSARAAVRLGGLYGLERLAQDNPSQRQTIVNVICAYLRMPFEPPANPRESKRGPRRSWIRIKGMAPSSDIDSQAREELLVRTTAQDILANHAYGAGELGVALPPRDPSFPDPGFWPDLELDLSGATLVHFTLQGRLKSANFSGARFVGGANFAHVEFDEHAYFAGTTFEGGGAHFFGARFGLRAIFSNTDFRDAEANFQGATFCGMVFFAGAKFSDGVDLDEARALAKFDTNWGSTREWPPGWTEGSLSAGEGMPLASGRWEHSDESAGEGTWKTLIRNPGRRA